MKRIYLAGPEVFWPNAAEVGRRKKQICLEYGVEGCFPLDNNLELTGQTPYQQGVSIFNENITLMRQCDGVIANMMPFRGPSMDVGTAFEMGFMMALNKPVFGYTADGRCYSDRVNVDDGCAVEQFDMVDNLMLVSAIERSGGQLVLPDLLERTDRQSDAPDVEGSLLLFRKLLAKIQLSEWFIANE